ncbi:uncharacterized protein LOC134775268 [Penaeus indicus]|uniref:uncharacterized protein LOC134775268 n=1 Tax=Penaeus indicus TaxID=29960 RepID=UPI00300D6A54
MIVIALAVLGALCYPGAHAREARWLWDDSYPAQQSAEVSPDNAPVEPYFEGRRRNNRRGDTRDVTITITKPEILNAPLLPAIPKPAPITAAPAVSTSQVQLVKPDSSWGFGWIQDLLTPWNWNSLLPDKTSLLPNIIGNGGLGSLGDKVGLLGTGTTGQGSGVLLPSLPGLNKPIDALTGTQDTADSGVTNSGIFIGQPPSLLPSLSSLGLPGFGLNKPSLDLSSFKPVTNAPPTPSKSEVLVIQYPEFIKTIGQGISKVSNAMTNLGLSVTNSISNKLSTGLLGSTTAAIGSGVASIIPLQDVSANTNHNKGSGNSQTYADASSLGPGLFIPNKGSNGLGLGGLLGGAGLPNKDTNALGSLLGGSGLGTKPINTGLGTLLGGSGLGLNKGNLLSGGGLLGNNNKGDLSGLLGNKVPETPGQSSVYVQKTRK